MSHSSGTIYKRGTREIVGYFEYNGTVDIIISAVHLTREELSANWRNADCMRECKCKEPVLQEIDIHADYHGDDTSHEVAGEMCMKCMTITSELDYYEARYKYEEDYFR